MTTKPKMFDPRLATAPRTQQRTMTEWENISADHIVLELYVGVQPLYGPYATRPKLTQEMLTGIVPVQLAPGERALIDSEYDQAIQTEECRDPGCKPGRRRYCTDPTHKKFIVAGLSPFGLRRVDSNRPAPEVHESLRPDASPFAGSKSNESLIAAAMGGGKS